MQIKDPHLHYLVDTFNKFPAYAFILEAPAGGQKAYECLSAINQALEHDPYTEYSVYVENRTIPVILPATAIYNTLEIPEFRGNLIATSVGTLPYLFMADAARKFFYVYDVNDIAQLDNDMFQTLLRERVTIFTRSESYSAFLRNMKIPVHGTVIPGFDLLVMRNLITEVNNERA